MATGGHRYRVVHRGELAWARVSSLGIAVLWLPLALAMTGGALAERRDMIATVLAWGVALGGLAVFGYLVRRLPVAWRPDPLLAVAHDGIEIRVERYGGRDLHGRRVHLSWSEISSIGVMAAPTWGAGPPGPPASSAVDGFDSYEQDRGHIAGAAHRWQTFPGRTLVVVGLQAGSAAQAGEFDRQLAAARSEISKLGESDTGEQLGTIAAQLAEWQRVWAATAQPVGMHVTVRNRDLDPARLAEAIRLCAPGRSLQYLGPVRPSDLDTPHYIAGRLAFSAALAG